MKVDAKRQADVKREGDNQFACTWSESESEHERETDKKVKGSTPIQANVKIRG